MRPVKPTPEQVRAAMAMYDRFGREVFTLGEPQACVRIQDGAKTTTFARWATVTHDPEGQAEAAITVLRLFQGLQGT